MTLNMAAIRAGLKANLGTIAGLNVYATAPDSIYAPCALVGYEPGDVVLYDETFGLGTKRLRLVVQVYISEATGAVDAQTALDPYINDTGAQSIVAALYADRKLGGACSDLALQRVRNEGLYEYNSVAYIGCEFVLDVIV